MERREVRKKEEEEKRRLGYEVAEMEEGGSEERKS